MMSKLHNFTLADRYPASAIVFICAASLMLSGCNTPQQKAHNSPTPIPPPPQQTSQTDSSQDTSGGQQQGAPQEQAAGTPQPGNENAADVADQSANAKQTKPANACEPSKPASSPDVEITDVPLDEHGNPIEPDSKILATDTQSQEDCLTAKNAQEEQQRQAEMQQQNNQASSQQQQNPGQRPPSGGVKTGGAQTSEEKLAAANANMDSRLAAFDELMRRAREAAEEQRAAANGGAGGQYGGYGGQYDGQGGNQRPPEVRGQGGQADTSSGLGHTPDHTGEEPPGDYKQVATGPVPANIPDGRDDDIVARQLREAASKETDPVLREKLWEEYKKYKTGIVGR